MNVNLVVRIRHPSSVIDTAMQQTALTDLFRSISAQTSDDFKCFIVCNSHQKLPPLPKNGVRVDVDIAPYKRISTFVDKMEVRKQTRADKGARLAAVFERINHEDYIMALDDDDLIHRDLVSFMNKQKPGQLWVIDKGYEWVTGSSVACPLEDFHQVCGTSVITPASFFQYNRLESKSPGAELDAAISEMGSHARIVSNAVNAGYTINCVPFRAAIYRQGHRNSEVSQMRKVQPESRNMSALGVAVRRLKRKFIALFDKTPKVAVDRIRPDFFGT